MGSLLEGTSEFLTPQNRFNAQGANIYSQNFTPQIQQSQQAFDQTQGQQQALAQALAAQAQGQGPNLAQNQLEKATQNNIAQNAGMMDSQRGINPGAAQRLIAQNTANQNQEAAGQSAIMRAQQQLAAQGQLGGLLNNVQGQNLQNQNIYQNAVAALNNANISNALGQERINAGTAAQNAAANQNTASGILNSLSSGMGMMSSMGMADGGMVPHYADGGGVGGAGGFDMGSMMNMFGGSKGGGEDKQKDPMFMPPDASLQIANQMAAEGGVPHYAAGMHVQPLTNMEDIMGQANPQNVMSMLGGGGEGGGMGSLAMLAAAARGGKIPGHAKVKGDSPKNDTVPAMLSPGEIVLPKSVVDSPDAESKAAEFVKHIKAGHKPSSFKDVVSAKRKLKSMRGEK